MYFVIHMRSIVFASFVACVLLATFRTDLRSANASVALHERVRCQCAIEEVYWKHRSAPKQLPPGLLSEDSLRLRVETLLRKSYALEIFWNRAIPPEALQAEINRQAMDSLSPGMLRELWLALGNNPLRIAECLARPVVVESIAGATPGFDVWWERFGGNIKVKELATRPYAYRLPELQGWNAQTPAPNAPSGRFGHSAVFTGPTNTSEMIVWGGQGFDAAGNVVFFNTGGRYSAATNSWTATSTVNAPSARSFHSATWTGKSMIVWGSGGTTNSKTGAIYDPITDSWKATNQAGAPAARSLHSATWTGTEAIIWGGEAKSGSRTTVLRSGARYNPTTDRWTPMPLANAPSARRLHTQNWNGFEMFIWGGESVNPSGARTFLNTGAIYHAPNKKWTAMSKTNAPSPRSGHTSSYSGNRIIYWGGIGPGANGAPMALNTGGIFNVFDKTWEVIPTAGAPSTRSGHSSQFLGGVEFAIWGGQSASGALLKNGAILNWLQRRWRPLSGGGAPQARSGHTSIGTGGEMVIWGGRGPGSLLFSNGARYNAVARKWTPF